MAGPKIDPWWSVKHKNGTAFQKYLSRQYTKGNISYAMDSLDFGQFLMRDPRARRLFSQKANLLYSIIRREIGRDKGEGGHIADTVRVGPSFRYDEKAQAEKIFSHHRGFGAILKRKKILSKAMRGL